jgi:predicted DNA-binding mobile mystery protein A
MSTTGIVRKQYQAIVDRAAPAAVKLRAPPEGWLRTVRNALGMSGAQLARRMKVTRARIAAAEQSELTGGITLKSMQAMAEALGCRFVYTIVPAHTVEEIVSERAHKKAAAIVGRASGHMALEDQALPKDKVAREIDRLAADMTRDPPPDFWDDE